MKCTGFASLLFIFWNKLKPSLSYPWPDVLLWLMTHVLVSSLSEIMECVTAVLGWLLPALAVSPARHPRGSCQHLLLSPPHRQRCTPPGATCCSTFLFLRFCPPPYLRDDKMGLGGPLTGQLVPACCAKLGSIIIWEVLIQCARKILQWRGCHDLPQPAALADRDREGAEFWEGKNEQESPRRAEGDADLYWSRVSGWPQGMSHLDIPPTSMEFCRLFSLGMMHTL